MQTTSGPLKPPTSSAGEIIFLLLFPDDGQAGKQKGQTEDSFLLQCSGLDLPLALGQMRNLIIQ